MSESENAIPELSAEDVPAFLTHLRTLTEDNELLLLRGQRKPWRLTPKIGRVKLRGEDILQSEKQMLQDFKQRSVPFLEYSIETEIEWLAMAQHYGLPTRLLDWTENPLAALWFAVRKCPQMADDKTTPDGVVWCLKPPRDRILSDADPEEIALNPLQGARAMVYRPRHITPRIIARSGWFTIHHFQTKTSGFGTFEWHTKFKPGLTRINIPHGAFPAIRRDLIRLNVHDDRCSLVWLGFAIRLSESIVSWMTRF